MRVGHTANDTIMDLHSGCYETISKFRAEFHHSFELMGSRGGLRFTLIFNLPWLIICWAGDTTMLKQCTSTVAKEDQELFEYDGAEPPQPAGFSAW